MQRDTEIVEKGFDIIEKDTPYMSEDGKYSVVKRYSNAYAVRSGKLLIGHFVGYFYFNQCTYLKYSYIKDEGRDFIEYFIKNPFVNMYFRYEDILYCAVNGVMHTAKVDLKTHNKHINATYCDSAYFSLEIDHVFVYVTKIGHTNIEQMKKDSLLPYCIVYNDEVYTNFKLIDKKYYINSLNMVYKIDGHKSIFVGYVNGNSFINTSDESVDLESILHNL